MYPFRRLLRFPLFYKILIANAAIIVLGAVAGTAVTANIARTPPEGSIIQLGALFALFGLLLSLLANALLLHLALSPLKLLEKTAELVRRGDFEARAPISPLADAELERLTRVFNRMLDSLTAYRRGLRDIALRAIHAQEEERKRIARELHDDTLQTLAALSIRVGIARRASDSKAREKLLRKLRLEIVRAADGVRAIVQGLRPPALAELGVVAATKWHARTFAYTQGLSIEVDAEPLSGLLPPERELALYRILQEAISNVARHAQATKAWVRLRREGDRVVARVEDDGKGFPASEVMAGSSHGLGLFGIKERAAYAGGSVDIDSRPGAGTRVRVEIPIPAEA